MSEVPQGTAQDVLDWVGDDPARAQAALEAELAGPNRSTLIPKLEAIASKEAAVSETTTDPDAPAEEVEEVPAPEQPTEVIVDAADAGTVLGPVNARDTDVEVPDDASLAPTPAEPEQSAEAEGEPIEAEQVEYFQTAAAGNGLVIAINGQAFAFGPQLVATLKGAVDQAIVGMRL